LDQLRQQLQRKEISVGDAAVKALPLLRGKVSDDTLLWLVSEVQGYSNAIEFYQNPGSSSVNTLLPEYRVVTGSLRLLDGSGMLKELKHPFASRGRYFLSAPVSWLEQFESLPGESALADCPDLTSYMGKGLGTVVCEFPKPQLHQIIIHIRQRLAAVLDKVSQARRK
jgi:hypothetical protein